MRKSQPQQPLYRASPQPLSLGIATLISILTALPAWSDTTITTHDGRTFSLPIEPADIVAIEPIAGDEIGLPPPSRFKPGVSIMRGDDGKPTSNLPPDLPNPRQVQRNRAAGSEELTNNNAVSAGAGAINPPPRKPPVIAESPDTADAAEPQPAPVRELPSQPGKVFPLRDGEPVPGLAELAAETPRGGWLLVPTPITTVLHKKEDLNKTTWGKGAKAVVSAWSGWAWDGNCGYITNGGHADYGGNEVYRFCFGDGWKRVIDSYVLPERTPENPCPQPTADAHGPPSSHTYDQIIWSPKTASVFYFNTGGFCKSGSAPKKPMVWEFKDEAWHRRRDLDFPIDRRAKTALDGDGNIVITTRDGVRILDPVAGQYIRTGGGRQRKFGSMIYVSELNRLFLYDYGGLSSIDIHTFQKRRDDRESGLSQNVGMAWHTPSRHLVFWDGAREIRLYDPVSKNWTEVQKSGGVGPTGKRPLSKWVYVPAHDVFVGLSSHDDGVWLYRLPPLD